MSRARTESAGDALCPVCHENTEIFAIGQCDHPICYRCSTRMRVLCDQTYCPICRGELPQIVHLTKKQKYADVERRSCIPNRKCKILFEDESVEEAFEALLEHRCLMCNTRPIFNDFKRLQTHMSRSHTVFPCDLCVSHLKIFPFERKFYTRSQLATHRRSGDPDNRSYRGHPSCRFCDDRYMDNDELLRHLRKAHYYCHFCDSNTSNNEYFADYPDLREHFQMMHFLCEEGPCGHPETQFTNAFVSEIDYKAHVAAEHMGNKSKAQARELRTIEVGFQMTRRRRGRDAGVIAPEDFEEVNVDNRGQRDRRQRRYNNQHESSSRRDNATPPPADEASGPPAPQPPTLDDFPTLGNGPLQYIPTAPPKPAEEVEDFPTLSSNAQSRPASITTSSLVSTSPRPGKTSASAITQKQPNNFSTLSSFVTSSGPGHPAGARDHPVEAKHPPQATTVTKQSWAAPRISSGEDFPSLGGNKKGKPVKGGSSHAPLGAWTKKQTTNSSKPPANKSGRDSPSAKSVSSLASLGRSLCDDGDFPSLGGSSPAKQATWVQKNTKPAKNKTEKPALGNCLVMPVRKKNNERAAQLNGASEHRTYETKLEKKKKQKEKETKASTEDSGISLSSIASEIDAVAVIPQETLTVKRHSSESSSGSQDLPSNDQAASSVSVCHNEPGERGETDESSGVPDGSGEWKTVNSKKSAAFHEDDFPSLSGLCRKSNGKLPSAKEFPSEDSTTKKNKPPATTTSLSFQDDFLSILNGSEKSSNAALGENADDKKSKKKTDWSKKSKPLLGDDFPELPAQTKKTKPPPGFQKADIAAPPPGLGTRPSSLGRRAPPGLNSMPSASASSSQLATSIPMSVKLNFYPYVLPQDGKERNSALVLRVRQLLILKDDGFASFCALSKDFRAGQLNAQEYHKTCQDLFGQKKFLEVLPELVALLPDILKQHELAVAHTQSPVGKGAPLNLATCQTCLQYLKVEDSVEHSSSHANLGQATSAALPLNT